jgi:hypothetical protein
MLQRNKGQTAMLTPYQIANNADKFDGLTNIKEINRLFRKQDESHLFPIRNKFNATERAIRRARAFQRDSGAVYGLEYALLLDQMLSDIVNSAI